MAKRLLCSVLILPSRWHKLVTLLGLPSCYSASNSSLQRLQIAYAGQSYNALPKVMFQTWYVVEISLNAGHILDLNTIL